jgi:hypothetical protein
MQMTKYFWFPILFLVANFLVVCQIEAQRCISTNSTFKTEEELTYVISYNWFFVWTEVGEVKLAIHDSEYNGIPAYQIIGTGKTYDNWDWFFKVRDKYQCEVDKQTMKPLFFRRDIKEGNYNHYETYNFDFKNKVAVSSHKVNTNPEKTDTVKIHDCVFDVLGAFLYSRNLEFNKFKPGDTFPISIILDQEIYNISFRYVGIENLKVKYAGEFECIKFSLSLIEGEMFKEEDKMNIWITNDKNHLPLYIESPIIVGKVKARISNIKETRYPLTSFKK